MSKTSTTCLWFSVDVHNAVCQYFTIHITHISKYEFEMWILTRQILKTIFNEPLFCTISA